MEVIDLDGINKKLPFSSGEKRQIDGLKGTSFFNKELTFFEQKFGMKEKEAFFSELSLLLSTGVDIITSLAIVKEEIKSQKHAGILEAISSAVIGGKRVSEAVSEQEGTFNKYETESIKIGEETGRLPEVLKELGLFYQGSMKLRRQIIGVLTYPVVVISMAILIVYFMLSFVVPVFSEIFTQTGNELPAITLFLIALSEKSGSIFGALIVSIAGVLVLHNTQGQKDWYRAATSGIVLRIPVVNKLVQKIYIARFCQSMKLLSGAKVMINESLDLVRNMIGYYPIEIALNKVKTDVVHGGKQLNESLSEHKVFPKKLVALIKLSEEVNAPETIFEKLHVQYTAEIEHQQAILGKIIEPVFIIVLGLFVGFILVAMYLPMFEMSSGSF